MSVIEIELKKNPMGVISDAGGDPVAVLNRNKPAFYCVTPEMFEMLMNRIEDLELVEIVRDRQDMSTVKVELNAL